MSGLQLYKQQNLDVSNFTPREIEIYDALQSPMIKDVPEAELYELFRYAVNKSYLMAVYTAPEPEQFTIVVDETMKMAKSKYGFVRAKEVTLIFVRGCSKEFGEFMGLSFITFMGWFDGYIKDKKRIELTTPAKEIKIPTDEQIHLMSVSNAVEAWKEYKSKGTCGRFGDVVYCFLESIGKIALSKKEKTVYWQKAKEEYERYLIGVRAAPVDLNERRKVENAFESFMNGGQKDRLIIISRRLVVDDYFLGLGGKELNFD